MSQSKPRLGRPIALAACAIAAIAASLTAVTGASAQAPGSTVTLRGGWAPFNRCPVDNPAMFEADPNTRGTTALCVVVDAPSGSMKIGNVNLVTGASNTQFGVVPGPEGISLVAPEGGVTVAAPVKWPGGLQALLCPGAGGFCNGQPSEKGGASTVTSTLENAGDPTNFSLQGVLEPEARLITLRYKLHLHNPLLGSDCYIGSGAQPLVIQPETFSSFTSLETGHLDGNGTPDELNGHILWFLLQNMTQGDKTFAAPVAQGCGTNGRFDEAIDRNVGLPAASGQNSSVLTHLSIYLLGESNVSEPGIKDGEELSKDWHSAVLEPTHGR